MIPRHAGTNGKRVAENIGGVNWPEFFSHRGTAVKMVFGSCDTIWLLLEFDMEAGYHQTGERKETTFVGSIYCHGALFIAP